MATIVVESRWPAASAEKLAKAWLEMGDVPEEKDKGHILNFKYLFSDIINSTL